MTVYEIPNIEHCNVEPIGNPAIGYRVSTHEGWCIHTTAHEENEYTRAIAIRADYDMSTIEIVEIATLPEDAEIHGGNETPKPEVM